MGLAGAAIGVGVAGAAASGISGAVGAGKSASAAKSAAAQQARAYQNASAINMGGLSQAADVLTPYTNAGATATGQLSNALTNGTYATGNGYLNNASGYLGSANNAYAAAEGEVGKSDVYTGDAANIYQTLQNGISEDTLKNTPGYQFTLGQGLESTQNSAAARGLGSSGAALKGAASYATGLADSTYQNQFNDLLNTATGYSGLAGNELTAANALNTTGSGLTNEAGTSINQQASALDTNQQNFNQLLAGSQLGLSAAGTYTDAINNASNAASGAATGAGTAQASGTVGAANAQNQGLSSIGSSVSGMGNNLIQSLLFNRLLSGSLGSTAMPSTGFNGSGASLTGNTGWVTN